MPIVKLGRIIAIGKELKQTLTVLLATCVAVVGVGAIIIYIAASMQTQRFLSQVIEWAKEDITYSDGRWDTARYDSDPEIPGPYRLYVIARDGFVIDRWRPIDGYLDTSDFRQLQRYTVPESVRAVTGQQWRVFSKPVSNSSNQTVGIVVVGRLATNPEELNETDEELRGAAERLAKDVKVDGVTLDATNISVRDVPYTLSFQVIDQFNKIHAKSDSANSIDRLPSYIDPSYIVTNLKAPTAGWVTDARHNETFMVQSVPLLDANNMSVGTIIAARTFSPSLELVKTYTLFAIPATVAIFALAAWRLYAWRSKAIAIQPKTVTRLKLDEITRIVFDKTAHSILINDRKLQLTFATNQYYLCQALLSAPKRKWATDELLDKIGEDVKKDGWRKLYDAMNGVNKKLGELIEPKLIIMSNKMYRINPALAAKVQKTLVKVESS